MTKQVIANDSDEVVAYRYALNQSECFAIKYTLKQQGLSTKEIEAKIDKMQNELGDMFIVD